MDLPLPEIGPFRWEKRDLDAGDCALAIPEM
jgi:hypothetical protein